MSTSPAPRATCEEYDRLFGLYAKALNHYKSMAHALDFGMAQLSPDEYQEATEVISAAQCKAEEAGRALIDHAAKHSGCHGRGLSQRSGAS